MYDYQDIIHNSTAVMGTITSVGGAIILYRKIFKSLNDRSNRLELSAKIDSNIAIGVGDLELAEMVYSLYQVKLGRPQTKVVLAQSNPLLALELLRNNGGILGINDNSIFLKPGKDKVIRMGVWLMRFVLMISLVETILMSVLVGSVNLPGKFYFVIFFVLAMACVMISFAFDQLVNFDKVKKIVKENNRQYPENLAPVIDRTTEKVMARPSPPSLLSIPM